jgi:DNA-binding NarL/FixJ family response regulator
LPTSHADALRHNAASPIIIPDLEAAPNARPNKLHETLTVFIRHIQSIQRASNSDPLAFASLREIVKHALNETERVCRLADVLSQAPHVVGINDLIAPSDDISRSRSPDRLTPRERQVLALLTEGMSNKTGAFQLSISVRTFEAHRASIMEKLGAKKAVDLIRRSLSQGQAPVFGRETSPQTRIK